MTRIFSFEGNIGSGKSTLVKEFENYYSDKSNCHGLNICFVQEPVDEWNTITDENGKTVIERFYANNKEFAFSFQMMAYISRLAILKKELAKGYDILFTERCLYTDRNVFAKMLYDEGKINEIEFKIYNKWFDEFISDFPKIEYIYIKTDPIVAFDRIIKRGRLGENIPLEYLSKCHDYHETWLSQYIDDKNIIDGNIDTSGPDGKIIIQTWIDKIKVHFSRYVVKFDGASRGNPGLCGAGYVIYENNKIIHKDNTFVGENNTNNYAEYYSLIVALIKCKDLNIKYLDIYGDSLLVIKQLNKEYKISSENLTPLYANAISILENFEEYTLNHIPREKNKEADLLANQAIDHHFANSVDICQIR